MDAGVLEDALGLVAADPVACGGGVLEVFEAEEETAVGAGQELLADDA